MSEPGARPQPDLPTLGSDEDVKREALRDASRGEPGSGGYRAVWPGDAAPADVTEHVEFQYADMPHQAETALSGMWLFLASEVLFFGGLFLLYMIYRVLHPDAVALASQRAEVGIGTANTLLLISSSAVFVYGLIEARRGHSRALMFACLATAGLGVAFLALKGLEWHDDLRAHLFPGPGFAITGPLSGPAQLFWSFYWVATVLHGAHMVVGVILVLWLAWTASRGRYSAAYYTPVEAVGLYWSFVDIVWMLLYPLIYLAGRPGA